MSKKRKALVLITISLLLIILNFIFEDDLSNAGFWFWLMNTAFVCIIIANVTKIKEWKTDE